VTGRDRSGVRQIVLVLILTIVAGLAMGCGMTTSSNPETAAPNEDQAPTIDPQDLVQSVVGIRASGCSLVHSLGSGVAIASNQVATAAHTVAGAKLIEVGVDKAGNNTDGLQWLVGSIVAFDKDNDLAIIEIEPSPNLVFRPLATRVTLQPGFLGTWDPDRGLTVVDVEISRRLQVTIEDIYIDEIMVRPAIEIKGTVTRGDSGGPIFTRDGQIAGIVYASSRHRDTAAFATRASEVVPLQATAGQSDQKGRCH